MANIESLMEKPWAIRAMDSSTPVLKIDGKDATVKTMSSEHNGKEILYPTIRMVDGKLKKFNEIDAKNEAIKNNDYVEFDTRDQATTASKELSNFIGFARDPKGTMEREEKEYQEHIKNMPIGSVKSFYHGVMAKPANEETKMEIWGSDFRNYLEFNRTSIPFMKVYDYFNPEKRED